MVWVFTPFPINRHCPRTKACDGTVRGGSEGEGRGRQGRKCNKYSTEGKKKDAE